jgi:hypothetical protein
MASAVVKWAGSIGKLQTDSLSETTKLAGWRYLLALRPELGDPQMIFVSLPPRRWFSWYLRLSASFLFTVVHGNALAIIV